MTSKRVLASVAILSISLFLCDSPPLFGSGPFFESPVFTYTTHPDLPLEKFVHGELGVLQPTYEGPALYVAYRYLIDMGFDSEEQKVVLNLWNSKLGLPSTIPEQEPVPEPERGWYDVRSRAPGAGVPSPVEVYRSVQADGYFVAYLNCQGDAFRTAAKTLTERIAQFGAESREVTDWLQAQDQVFANCAEGQTIPAAAAPELHPLIQADRAYQIAAAHFYAGNFDIARKMFEDIAKDSSSPWRQLAPYLVARTLLRKATVDAGLNRIDWATFAQAEVQLQEVLKDSSLSAVYPAAQRLLNFVRARLRPAERLQELARAVLRPHSGATLRQDLSDYMVLPSVWANRMPDQQDSQGKRDELADWTYTLRGGREGAFEYAWQKWQETVSPAWLVASLVNASQPLPAIFEVAAKVERNSPAFLTVTFHHIRLLIESGRKDEARERLDALLSSDRLTGLPSTRNLFLAQRLRLARDLDEFLRYTPRVPVGILDETDMEESPLEPKAQKALIEATGVLNELPLDLLQQAAASTALPPHLRREVALATWVRAVLLENTEVGKALTSVLANLMPELKADFNAYRSAKSQEARKFAAVFLLLKLPGARPYLREGFHHLTPPNHVDNYRDNWWPGGGVALNSIDFLNETQKAAAMKEAGQLPAVDRSFGQVIMWAKEHPDDPRIPEALHRTVKLTRYGCSGGDFSRQAFQLLHKRYPRNEWTEKTKYWYSCN